MDVMVLRLGPGEWAADSARCRCCEARLDLRGACPVCDSSGPVSPPHVCIRVGRVVSDEHGCAPDFAPLAPDHETPRAA